MRWMLPFRLASIDHRLLSAISGPPKRAVSAESVIATGAGDIPNIGTTETLRQAQGDRMRENRCFRLAGRLALPRALRLWCAVLRAFAVEEVLLGPAGVGTEVGAGKLSQLAGGDAFFAGEVDAAEGALDPHVDGKGVVESAGEEQGAVGDFLADPGQFDQFFQRAVVVHRAQGVEVELAAIDQAGGGEQVFGAEAEFAIPELLVRGAGDDGDGRERMVLGVNRLAEPLGKQTDDLADLDDLFRRTGDERGETFPRFLADDAQAVMVAGGLVEQGIAGEGSEDFWQGNVECEIVNDDGRNTTLTLTLSPEGRGDFPLFRCARRYGDRRSRGSVSLRKPFQSAIGLSQAPDFLADDADEPAIGVALPAKGLAAFQREGERKIRNIDCVRHFWYKLARGTLVMLNEEVNTACPARSGMHFVGICGTAMASVAALCRELGHTVTGSDENVYPPMSTFLESRGIRILSGLSRIESRPSPRPDRHWQRDEARAIPRWSARSTSGCGCVRCRNWCGTVFCAANIPW